MALVLAACSSGSDALPKVPHFAPAPTTTTELDYSNVDLRGVTGRATTTTIPIGPGHATLNGVVTGDAGPVAGATVLLERVVGGASAQVALTTAADGTWTAPNVLGGRYRARAFRQPDLVQTTPVAVFIGATETKQLELRVSTVGGLDVSSSVAPNPPPIDRDVQLVVLVTEKTVDAAGVVREQPLPNQSVDLSGSGGWRVESTNPTSTDGRGHAVWLLRCQDAGRNPLAVSIGTQSIPLSIAACFDATVPETTTTTVPSSDTTTP